MILSGREMILKEENNHQHNMSQTGICFGERLDLVGHGYYVCKIPWEQA